MLPGKSIARSDPASYPSGEGAPTRGSHTRDPPREVGGSQGSLLFQLAGVALSLHRPGRVTNPRAATAQMRAKKTRQPRSRIAPLSSAIISASHPYPQIVNLSRPLVVRLDPPC